MNIFAIIAAVVAGLLLFFVGFKLIKFVLKAGIAAGLGFVVFYFWAPISQFLVNLQT